MQKLAKYYLNIRLPPFSLCQNTHGCYTHFKKPQNNGGYQYYISCVRNTWSQMHMPHHGGLYFLQRNNAWQALSSRVICEKGIVSVWVKCWFSVFLGALKPPRGSFKHKLNFNCFVQDLSETMWMQGWVVCHCYRLRRQMVTGVIAAMTPGSKGSWINAE